MALWRSGYAAVCKTAYTGSIPVGASKSPLWGIFFWQIILDRNLTGGAPFSSKQKSANPPWF